MLQEQYWSDFLDSSLPHKSWTLLEPTIKTEHAPRSAIYVNNNALSSAALTQVRIPLPDITAITITPNDENDKSTLLVNVYKPGDKILLAPCDNILPNTYAPRTTPTSSSSELSTSTTNYGTNKTTPSMTVKPTNWFT